MTTLLLLLFALAGAAPWWIAGRYGIPERERVPLRDMAGSMILGTLVRGACCFIPAHLR